MKVGSEDNLNLFVCFVGKQHTMFSENMQFLDFLFLKVAQNN